MELKFKQQRGKDKHTITLISKDGKIIGGLPSAVGHKEEYAINILRKIGYNLMEGKK